MVSILAKDASVLNFWAVVDAAKQGFGQKNSVWR